MLGQRAVPAKAVFPERVRNETGFTQQKRIGARACAVRGCYYVGLLQGVSHCADIFALKQWKVRAQSKDRSIPGEQCSGLGQRCIETEFKLTDRRRTGGGRKFQQARAAADNVATRRGHRLQGNQQNVAEHSFDQRRPGEGIECGGEPGLALSGRTHCDDDEGVHALPGAGKYPLTLAPASARR